MKSSLLRPAHLVELAFLFLLFSALFSKGAVANDFLINQLFPTNEAEINRDTPENWSDKASQFRADLSYGHWLESISKPSSNQRFLSDQYKVQLLYHFPKMPMTFFGESAHRLEVYQQAEKTRLERYATKKNQNTLGLLWHPERFNLALIYDDGELDRLQGLIGVKPFKELMLFYKQLNLTSEHLFQVQFTAKHDEDLFSAPTEDQYALKSQINWQCEMTYKGLKWNHNQLSIDIQSGNSLNRGCDDQQWSLEVPINKAWTVKGYAKYLQNHQQSSPIFDRQQLIGRLWLQSDLEINGVVLNWNHDSWRHQFSYQHSSYALKGLSRFSATHFGGYFSSLVLGDGEAKVDSQVEVHAVEWKLEKSEAYRQGWQPVFGVGWSDIHMDSPYGYKIYAFPFGLFDKFQSDIDYSYAQLMQMTVGVGFQGRHWELTYKMSQWIPLELKKRNRGEATGNGSGSVGNVTASSKDGLSLDKWPDGNQQSLSVTYRF